MNGKNKSSVSSWYDGRSIFITGGSGFMGKVLIEKLLYSCSGINTIYILMRPKKSKTPEERLETMWMLPMFNRLRESQPMALKKIVPLKGDLNIDGLGLSKLDLEVLTSNVSIIFHLGATLKLEAPLKDAIEQNTAGTARVIDIAKKIKNLKIFLHFSTAFCSADINEFQEKIYKCSDNPRDVMEVAKWIKDDALVIATPNLIHPHPNTYTYSKRLAEQLIEDEKHNLPVCIIRPSIVTPAVEEPLPGWVDSLNGPMGLLVAAGKGVLRSMHCKGDNRAQIVPVDIAINASIVIAQKVGSEKQKFNEVPVYNLSQDEVLRITYREIIDVGRDIIYEHPFEMQIWYPDGDIRESYFMHSLFCIFFHWIPAYFIDFLLFIFRQKRFMIHIQRKIHDGLELLQFFTVRNWVFKTSNFLHLIDDMSEEDKKIFSIDFFRVSVKDYIKLCILGARQYLMKEDLSSLPRCRIQQKFLYVLHKTMILSFYFLIFWLIISSSTTAKSLFDEIVNFFVMQFN